MNIESLLSRSASLETEELLESYTDKDVGSTSREKTTYIMCSIIYEHARSLRILIGVGNYTSGIGMLRIQYEALVRAVWVFYAASEMQVSKLSEELTNETEKAASKLPMLSEMLTQIEKKAPAQAFKMLNEIKEQSWKAMNSYIHTGLHALARCKDGYPALLVGTIIKHSNDIWHH